MTYRSQIERLTPKAESGEQWAEICRLEVLAVAEETEAFCACGAKLHSEQEQRNEVCDECL